MLDKFQVAEYIGLYLHYIVEFGLSLLTCI